MTTLARILALAALTVGLASCAGGTEYDDTGRPPSAAAAGGDHAGHEGAPGATTATTPGTAAEGGEDHSGHSGAAAGSGDAAAAPAPAGESDMEEMEVLAKTETKDLAVELHAMPPELFYVSEGDDFRPQRPTDGDSAHLMVTLADRESGVRLPDATVTVRLVDEQGETAFEGPLYPMVGRGMGLHYGENVRLPKAGQYEVRLVVGPPRVGRHRAVGDAWNTTTRVEQAVEFDGKQLRPR